MWVDMYSIVDHLTIVPTFVGVYYDHNWLGLFSKLSLKLERTVLRHLLKALHFFYIYATNSCALSVVYFFRRPYSARKLGILSYIDQSTKSYK